MEVLDVWWFELDVCDVNVGVGYEYDIAKPLTYAILFELFGCIGLVGVNLNMWIEYANFVLVMSVGNCMNMACDLHEYWMLGLCIISAHICCIVCTCMLSSWIIMVWMLNLKYALYVGVYMDFVGLTCM